MLELECPSCHKPLRLPESAIGREVACPRCRFRFQIGDPDALELDLAEMKTQIAPPPSIPDAIVLEAVEPEEAEIVEDVAVEKRPRKRTRSEDDDDRPQLARSRPKPRKRPRRQRPIEDDPRDETDQSWLVGGFMIFLGVSQILGASLNLIAPHQGHSEPFFNIGFLTGPGFIMFGLSKIPR